MKAYQISDVYFQRYHAVSNTLHYTDNGTTIVPMIHDMVWPAFVIMFHESRPTVIAVWVALWGQTFYPKTHTSPSLHHGTPGKACSKDL